MGNRKLTNTEVAQLLLWSKQEGSRNWGSWGNYPLAGCSYESFEECSIRIKFDNDVEYQGEVFRLLGNSRRIPGKGDAITLFLLEQLYKSTGDSELQTTLDKLANEAQVAIEQRESERELYRSRIIARDPELMKQIEESVRLNNKPYVDININIQQYISLGKLDTITIQRSFYFGSSATAVFNNEECEQLLKLEQELSTIELSWTKYGRSNKGNTYYFTATPESARIIESYTEKSIEIHIANCLRTGSL